MKDMRFCLGFAAMAAMGLTSCYSDISFDNQLPERVPVINAVATPDTVVMASVSRTYYASEDLTDIQLSDADVSLFVNGSLRGKMTPVKFDVWYPVGSVGTSDELRKNKIVYVSDYVPSPGDRIAVEASTSFGNAHVEDRIPAATPIENLEVECHTEQNDWGTTQYKITYKIRFQDIAGTDNYYFLSIAAGNMMDIVFVRFTDPVFALQNQDITDTGSGAPEGFWGWTFDDSTIDGRLYELEVCEDSQVANGSGGDTLTREVRLYSVSEDYYKYLRSVLKDKSREESDLGDLGFYEPVEIFSNVEGGVGIMGAQCCSRKTVDIKVDR